MARCQFTPRAEADLDDIWYQVARHDFDAADRVLERIRTYCQNQATYPLSGTRQDALIPHLRRFVVAKYLVFYFPTGDGINIMRVVHGSREIDRLFED
ncbi:MAG: hypothetical protein RhofKO_24980 [Rhodothermales bacterium]